MPRQIAREKREGTKGRDNSTAFEDKMLKRKEKEESKKNVDKDK